MWGVLGGFEWSPAVQPLVAALVLALQQRMMAVLQRAYATLAAAQLTSYLGMPEPAALHGESSCAELRR